MLPSCRIPRCSCHSRQASQADRDHLGEVDGVLRPEFGAGGHDPLARGLRDEQAHPPGQAEPERDHVGQRLQGVGDRPGQDRVVLQPLAVSLEERPLLRLAERPLLDALPDRGQPEDQLQAVGLADVLDRPRGREADRPRAARSSPRRARPGARTGGRRAARPDRAGGRSRRPARPANRSGRRAARARAASGPRANGSTPRAASACESPNIGHDDVSVRANRLMAIRGPVSSPARSRSATRGSPRCSAITPARAVGLAPGSGEPSAWWIS